MIKLVPKNVRGGGGGGGGGWKSATLFYTTFVSFFCIWCSKKCSKKGTLFYTFIHFFTLNQIIF